MNEIVIKKQIKIGCFYDSYIKGKFSLKNMSIEESDPEFYDEKTLRWYQDKLHDRMNNSKNLRYQVAAIFIALISALWTAIGAIIATTIDKTLLVSYFSITYGCIFTIILLCSWRIFTHFVAKESEDEIKWNDFLQFLFDHKTSGKEFGDGKNKANEIWENKVVSAFNDRFEKAFKSDKSNIKRWHKSSDVEKQNLINKINFEIYNSGITYFDRISLIFCFVCYCFTLWLTCYWYTLNNSMIAISYVSIFTFYSEHLFFFLPILLIFLLGIFVYMEHQTHIINDWINDIDYFFRLRVKQNFF